MAPTDTAKDSHDSRSQFFWFERDAAGDFPFYNGIPRSLSGSQWAIVLAGVVLGFAALIAPVEFYRTTVGGFVAVIVFFAIPLAALAIVAGNDWKALFRRLGFRDFLWILGVAVANIAVSVVVVLLLRHFFDMNPNPVGGILGEATDAERTLFYLNTIPQLFGEEVVSVIPFLAKLWLCHAKLGMQIKPSVLLAWLGAALFFGAIHLPTYEWNFVQCFVVIGTARVVLLLGYLATKNILVSTGAHIINDWATFTLIVVLGSQATIA
jgi:membrane protease YdiL (CAAX protease family)